MNEAGPHPDGDGLPSAAEISSESDGPDTTAVEATQSEESALVAAEPAEVLPAEKSPGSLEPTDSLTRYMAELRQYAPISREEEHELALRWVQDGDPDAARQLVLSNLRLVVKIAFEYRRAWANTLDLIQEGNVGLAQAVQRFDPFQGTRLASYAAYWIRAYILKYLIDNIRLVRLGKSRAQRKLFFRLNKEKRELERQGFKPAPKLIAERLDVSEEDVIEMEQRLSGSDLSLDAPVGDEDGGASFGDFVVSDEESAEGHLADSDLRRVFLEQVRDFAENLGEREKRIMSERVLADPPATLQELGDELGVTRERVRQLEKKLVDDLREYLRENVVDFEYYAPSVD
ncbi:MAG: RNA polymerase factor sigma-32 [Myxococcota bacterium]|nr:RNA polymerase factor sigma-32 [Myxococcota bacterium]